MPRMLKKEMSLSRTNTSLPRERFSDADTFKQRAWARKERSLHMFTVLRHFRNPCIDSGPLEETNHLSDRFSLPGGRCGRPLHRMSPSALLPSMCSPDRWRLCLLLQLSIPVTPCILLSAMEHIDMSESSVLRTFASSKQGRLQAVDVRLGYSSAGLDEVPQQVTFTLRHLPTFVSLQYLARFECSTLTKCSKCRLQPLLCSRIHVQTSSFNPDISPLKLFCHFRFCAIMLEKCCSDTDCNVAIRWPFAVTHIDARNSCLIVQSKTLAFRI